MYIFTTIVYFSLISHTIDRYLIENTYYCKYSTIRQTFDSYYVMLIYKGNLISPHLEEIIFHNLSYIIKI